jgi:hypothetical protein
LYHQRWEIETAFDALKTHLRGAQIVLRSKTPELVKQEFYGLLMAHFAVRGLMHEAALKADEDPDRLSFASLCSRFPTPHSALCGDPPLGREQPFLRPSWARFSRNGACLVAIRATHAA